MYFLMVSDVPKGVNLELVSLKCVGERLKNMFWVCVCVVGFAGGFDLIFLSFCQLQTVIFSSVRQRACIALQWCFQ